MEGNAHRGIILWFFLGLFLISALLLGWLIWPFISILILALVVTGVFNPVYRLFNRILRPALASLLTCIVIFFVLFIPTVLFAGILSKEAYDLYLMGRNAVSGEQLRDFFQNSRIFERANLFLANFSIQLTGDEFFNAVSEIGKFVGLFLYKQASAIASNVFAFLINFFFMLVITYFMFIDGHKLVSFITDLSPLPPEQDDKLIQKFKDIAHAVLFVNGLGGFIQGTLGGIIFAIFGLKSPILWGVIMGLLAFLPVFGSGVVFIPATLFLFLKGRIGAAIFFISLFLVISGVVEYFIKPRMVGHRVKMHTLLVFLSVIGGLKLFGILGIIYGPLVVTAFLTLNDIYRVSYQRHVEEG